MILPVSFFLAVGQHEDLENIAEEPLAGATIRLLLTFLLPFDAIRACRLETNLR
jgi:hypothetical protein